MIRRVLLLTAVIPLLSARAQGHKTVRWGKAPNFSISYYDGVPRERYDDSFLRIVVLPPSTDRGNRGVFSVTIDITNRRREEIDVDPARFIALSSDPKDSKMTWIDGGQILAKEERSADRRRRIAAGLAGFGAGAGTQTATVYNSDGSTSTVEYHDPTATDQVAADSRTRAKEIQDQFAMMQAHVLRRNTVSPGSYVVGNVYFQGRKGMNKKASIAELDIPIDGIIYQFLWSESTPVPLRK